MTWTEKEKPTPFDNQPIRGLFFLDGDVLARRIGHDWTAGQKYPMVMFPSGVECPLWETSDAERVGIVHVYGLHGVVKPNIDFQRPDRVTY